MERKAEKGRSTRFFYHFLDFPNNDYSALSEKKKKGEGGGKVEEEGDL